MSARPNDPCPCGSGRKYKKCHGQSGQGVGAGKRGIGKGGDGMTLLERGRRLLDQGRLSEASDCLARARGLDPDNTEVLYVLGALAEVSNNLPLAQSWYEQALTVSPDHARSNFALGNLWAGRLEFEQARSCYLKALENDPRLPGVWQNLGNVEKYLGRFAAAMDCYRKELPLDPDPASRARRHSNLLIALHYDESLDHEALYQAHVDWARQHAEGFRPARDRLRAAPARQDGRLRVGYLSGSFDGRILGHFLLNVLACHDRGRFHLSAFSSTRSPDTFTERLKSHFDAWTDISGQDDGMASDTIRAAGLDLLVDLDGHSPTGRPLVLARKPAPVIVEWLDWFDTTGLDTVDYIVSDPYTTPLDSPQRFTERVYRLPDTRFCYAPPDYAPPVATTPCQSTGTITFGSFNRQDKIHPALIRVWADILHGVPDSRLLLKNRALAIPAVQDQMRRRFADAGIGNERLVLRGPSPHPTMLAEYAEVDIALDTYPYNGGLTTCECLWMGVPIVALEAERMIGRQTAALLRLLGLDAWVADSEANYIARATTMARDWTSLAQTRAGIRPAMQASTLCTPERFTAQLEAAFLTLCHKSASAAQANSPKPDAGPG